MKTAEESDTFTAEELDNLEPLLEAIALHLATTKLAKNSGKKPLTLEQCARLTDYSLSTISNIEARGLAKIQRVLKQHRIESLSDICDFS